MIAGAIKFRDDLAKENNRESKACYAVKMFVRNNHDELSLSDKEIKCIDWKKVVDHFREKGETDVMQIS